MTAQNDAAFLRMFLLVLGALVIFTIAILVIANRVTSPAEPERGEDPRERAAISERIAPVGRVNVASAPAPAEEAGSTEAAAPRGGEAVVASACASCHQTGILESPMIGDEAAWSQRLDAAGGLDGLTTSAINGKGLMPARGGAAASDAEIRAAIVHMLEKSGVDVASAGGEGTPAADGAEESAGTARTTDDATAESAAPVADAAPQADGDMTAPSQPEPAAEAGSAAEVPETAAASTEEEAPAGVRDFDLAKGKAVYDSACFACHAAGVAGAPKLGDKGLWGPRVAQGYDTLIASVINGKGAMPPKGGRPDLDDEAIRNAVGYMVDAAQ